jgi:hypothetical protein
MVSSTMASSDFSSGFSLDFASSAYTSDYDGCGPPTGCDLSCSVVYFHRIPFPVRRRVLRRCFSRFFAPSVAFALADKLGSPLFPFRG